MAIQTFDRIKRETTVDRRLFWGARPMTRDELLAALHACDVETGDHMVGLDQAFTYTMAIGLRTAGTYERQEAIRRWASYAFRVGGIVGLVLGVLAPLATPLAPVDFPVFPPLSAAQLPHVGYVFMALGGALMLADRVFVATSGWTRVVTAQVALEDRLVSLLYEWKIRELRRGGRAPTRQAAIAEWTFLMEAADSFMEDYKVERGAWKQEVQAGAGELAGHLRFEQLVQQVLAQATAQIEGAGRRARETPDAHLDVVIDFSAAPEGAHALVAFTEDGEAHPEEKRVEPGWPVAPFAARRGTHRISVVALGVADPIVEDVRLDAGRTEHRVKPW